MYIIEFIQCLAGHHQWGDWEHYQLWGLDRGDRCGQKRMCIRCGKVEQSTLPHQWSDQLDLHGNQCEQREWCIHCGSEKLIKYDHQWASQYLKEGDCTEETRCIRCGKMGWTSEVHQWGGPQDDGYGRICVRCNEREFPYGVPGDCGDETYSIPPYDWPHHGGY